MSIHLHRRVRVVAVAVVASSAVALTAAPAGAFGPVGTTRGVTLADGTTCSLSASVGKDYGKPTVSSLDSVSCSGRLATLDATYTLRSPTGATVSASTTATNTGFASKVLTASSSLGDWTTTATFVLNGQPFDVSATRTVTAGS